MQTSSPRANGVQIRPSVRLAAIQAVVAMLLAVLLALGTAGAWAQAAGSVAAPTVASTAVAAPGKALAQLKRFVSETRSARGEFTQSSPRGRDAGTDQSSGRFAFARPGRFRWEVLRPFEQLMVADGERLHFLDRDLNQVTERKLADSLGASPAAILFGSDDLDKSFSLREAGDKDSLAWLEAVPRTADAGFERIVIGFRDGLPLAMEVKDAFGRTTRFVFTAIERNPAIDSAQFRFIAPAGADVVRQ